MSCEYKHVVVTGASSGIGRATALQLAADGWHVYAGVRRTEDGESLRADAGPASSTAITPLMLDITKGDQITAAVDTVAEHVGAAGLDGLVDNAGIGVAWPMELLPLDDLRRQFEVNVIGQVAVTQGFLPLLRRAVGRIVVISSIGDLVTPPFGGPLAASKSAVRSLADGFRQELAPWGIRVVIIKPASIHTDGVDKLESDAAKVTSQFSAEGAALYRDAYTSMISAALANERRGSAPSVVAAVVAKALTKRRPRGTYLVGKDALVLAGLARLLPTPAFDAVRRKVFQLPPPRSQMSETAHTKVGR
ncbi:SDR family NAD(P)-dependent oxidoreductase [Mycobacterium sp. CVI_P3]|uniref:SDR family NAD(P)-dependent oxidoreductase n=1 Tax=Mycobacterium pinniadriaticum TaxID=2994102 RepID=A0ABT3SAG1_9MYCO|nr:SDR family NAD(P)-dependent oxidoreductase [Mycobacterium pinniadriaticum]MCX2929433.1 SDR family NAD(P)-dependent oxidoreductase [Mycobacterium pinniadriaticum]MCX2935857.1 SDR family NAD(P)-dependent oxidoreductase [Mycobacterium pinniadriaticum]